MLVLLTPPSSDMRFESARRRPSEQKTLQKKCATIYTVQQPIAAGRPDFSGFRSFISNLACVLNQGLPVTQNTKSQESWEAIWSFHWPPSTPTPPTNAPQLGRGGTLYRGSAGCPTNEASTQTNRWKKKQLHKQICGGAWLRITKGTTVGR